jgi:AhpC/TSA family protein
MYGHERSLVQRFRGRPFVILGVNSDEDRHMLRKVMARQGLPWRAWWDGGQPGGPVATRYQVRAWPTIFVIDADGIIRYSGNQLAGQEQIIEKLVRQAERRRAG